MPSRESHRVQGRYYRVFAARYGDDPPWKCHFCHMPILRKGRFSDSLHRHHLDGDFTNDIPENLVPAHQACHVGHEQRGVSESMQRFTSHETREKIVTSQRARRQRERDLGMWR